MYWLMNGVPDSLCYGSNTWLVSIHAGCMLFSAILYVYISYCWLSLLVKKVHIVEVRQIIKGLAVLFALLGMFNTALFVTFYYPYHYIIVLIDLIMILKIVRVAYKMKAYLLPLSKEYKCVLEMCQKTHRLNKQHTGYSESD